MNLVEDYLATADLSDAPGQLGEFRPAGSVLLTPRFRHSRYVVTLLYDAGGRPRLVAKTSRVPGDQGTLGDEFSVLRAVTDRAGDGFAPFPLALAEHRGHWMLVQTAMPGRILGSGKSGTNPDKAWKHVDAWLVRFARASADTAPARWWDAETLDRIRAVAGFLPAEHRARLLLTEEFARPLRDVVVPRPIQHGDFMPSNVLIHRRRTVSIIDWELGDVSGLPGADAAVFLAALYFGCDQARTDDDKVASYRRRFLRADGAGRARLVRHLTALGVDLSLVDQLLLAAWARYTLAAFTRAVPLLSAGESRRPAVDTTPPGAWWGAALWLATIEHLSASST